MNQQTLRFLIRGLLLLTLLTGCQPITAETSMSSAARPASDPVVYQDPSGLFTVPVPTNWSVEEEDGYVLLTDPEAQIHMYALVLPGNEIERAIELAWTQVDPNFNLEPTQVQEQPVMDGIEEEVIITYDAIATAERLALASGRRYDGNVYLTLLDAELAALERRTSQVNTVLTGMTITGLTQIDLADVAPLPFDAELQAQFETYVLEAMARFQVPGVAVAVVQDGEIVYLQGFGVKELGQDERVTPATLMMIGSTTKTFTTLLMAQLVGAGQMAWDTPVVEILPDFRLADPELTQQVTVQNLVCNCTGVSRRDLELLFNAQELTAEDVIASLSTFEIFTDFGETFQYSNQMIATGGYAAAAAAGADGDLYTAYQQALQAQVLDPIGMANTTLAMPQAAADYATPHGLDLSFTYTPIPLSQEEFVRPVAPAGALWSTAADMGRYLITQLNRGIAPDGTRIIAAENLQEIWEPQVAVSANTSYGLGWFVSDYKGQPMLHHGGNTIGFTSDLAFLPEAGIGISVLTNARASSLNQAMRYRLLELIFEQAHEYDPRAIASFNAFKNEYGQIAAGLTQVETEQVRPYLGQYHNAALGDATLLLRDDVLILDVGEFETELRPEMNEDGTPAQTFITYNAPGLTGIPVRLEDDEEGTHSMIFGLGTFEYLFEMVE